LKVQVCIKNQVLAEAVKKIVLEEVPEAILGGHCLSLSTFAPDIVLFTSQYDILAIKQHYDGAKLICFDLGMKESELAYLICFHGVRGIISSSLRVEILGKALRKVHQGEVWLNQKQLHLLLQKWKDIPEQRTLRNFSEQDRKIIQLVAEGESNKKIAKQLCLSLPTVKAHLTRIFKWLNIENRSQLAVLASKELALPPE